MITGEPPEGGDRPLDSLTGLPNRKSFMTVLETYVARVHRDRHNGRLSIAVLDLDNFKRVNDNVGHIAGDAVLVTLAGHLRDTLRPDDVASRLGGDEFLLLLPESSATEATQRLERLASNLTENPRWPQGLTFSYGIAQLAHDQETAQELLARADNALWDNKRPPPAASSGVREPRLPTPSTGSVPLQRTRSND
jgi:diguanylate cyclase (GGDEF)-like protein